MAGFVDEEYSRISASLADIAESLRGILAEFREFNACGECEECAAEEGDLCRISRKMAGVSQAVRSMRAPTPSGSTRGRFSMNAPPVRCDIALMVTLAAHSASTSRR